jgi:hypothetical protein
MAEKEKLSEALLRQMILDEAKRHPECSKVERIAITRPLGQNWGADPVWVDASRNPECKRLLHDFVNQLRAKYELST